MPTMVERTCRCGAKFQARAADVKRGWGRFCSKSCKAIRQEQRTGQHAAHLHGQRIRDANDGRSARDLQREHGGHPVFNRRGEYEGFLAGPFDNTDHQDKG